MATDLRSLPAFLADTATFRTWSQGIDAQLRACGLVLTADTGQVDLTTAVLPAANAYAGYKIYRFADALQATKSVFIKLEFGVGSPTDKPQLRFQSGTGTNGAGTLTGNVVPASPTVLATAASKTAGITLPSYCSGDGSRVALVTNLDNASGNFRLFMLIDRARNADGSGNGGAYFYYVGGSAVNMCVVPFTGTPPSSTNSTGSIPLLQLQSSGMMSQAGSEAALFPVFAVWGRPYPLLAFMGYAAVDIGELVAFSAAAWLGAARTFMPLGDGGPPTATASQWLAILWE